MRTFRNNITGHTINTSVQVVERVNTNTMLAGETKTKGLFVDLTEEAILRASDWRHAQTEQRAIEALEAAHS